MVNITLPDGHVKQFDVNPSVFDVANSISPGLAKSALAGKVNGKLVDLTFKLDADCTLSVITHKEPEALEIIRHSTAHLLAQAVKRIFPDVQITIGPVIEDGFYYDFATQRPFTPEDLILIEAQMAQIVKENLTLSRRELSRDEAIKYFQSIGEHYKAEIIADIPKDEILSLYKQGDFEDLCRGPHVPATGKLKVFKLLKIAGAYWRGDSSKQMLQRIYGTAFLDKKSLEDFLFRIEEAEKRDHRKLGKLLNLFHFQEIAPGMVFWHANGLTIYREIEQYMRKLLQYSGYQEIRTPQLVDRSLWEKSGHWENFKDAMFITETESRLYSIKPMNCPGHIQIFNQGLKSYRDLPLRFSEFGTCHRCEPSGSLHGLMRVRGFVQDDAHIFCTDEQIQAEVANLIRLVQEVYKDFGFTEIKYRLAMRPEKRVGSEEIWDKAEEALRQAMRECSLEWVDAPGEGAFYGPKIECSLADCLGRIWQCGTIQVDFSMPNLLSAEYVAEDGKRKIPVMIHRAILGSFERFIGILIEHHAGNFPLWLAPTQVSVLTITEKHDAYAQEIFSKLTKKDVRAKIDLRNEKVGFKIREHSLQKIPYLIIIGDKEIAENKVSVRIRGGEDLGMVTYENFCDKILQEIKAKQ